MSAAQTPPSVRTERQKRLATALTCSRHRQRPAVFVFEPHVHDVQADGPSWLCEADGRPPRADDPPHPRIVVLCAECAVELRSWAYPPESLA